MRCCSAVQCKNVCRPAPSSGPIYILSERKRTDLKMWKSTIDWLCISIWRRSRQGPEMDFRDWAKIYCVGASKMLLSVGVQQKDPFLDEEGQKFVTGKKQHREIRCSQMIRVPWKTFSRLYTQRTTIILWQHTDILMIPCYCIVTGPDRCRDNSTVGMGFWRAKNLHITLFAESSNQDRRTPCWFTMMIEIDSISTLATSCFLRSAIS